MTIKPHKKVQNITIPEDINIPEALISIQLSINILIIPPYPKEADF